VTTETTGILPGGLHTRTPVRATAPPFCSDQNQGWPPQGTFWFGVSRWQRGDISQPANFGGNGFGGAYNRLICATVPQGDFFGPAFYDKPIAGLAASTDNQWLYVSVPSSGLIRKYRADTMTFERDWNVMSLYGGLPGGLALNSNGDLWAVIGTSVLLPDHNDPSDRLLGPLSLPNSGIPAGISWDSPRSQLLVCDKSSNCQIQKINLDGSFDPQPHGQPGGAYQVPTKGTIDADHFAVPIQAAKDQAGQLYILQSVPECALQCVDSTTTPPTQLWDIYGLAPQYSADLDPDPADDTKVHLPTHRFTATWGIAGEDRPRFQWVSTTVDPFRFPNDPRLLETYWSPILRRGPDGRTYMFVQSWEGESLAVYRQDDQQPSNIWVPCGLFVAWNNSFEDDLLHQYGMDQTGGSGIWVNMAGDGRYHDHETQGPFPTEAAGNFGHCWAVDDDGSLNVWFGWYGTSTINGQLRKFTCQGIMNGVPQYSLNSDYTSLWSAPSPCFSIGRVERQGGEHLRHGTRPWTPH